MLSDQCECKCNKGLTGKREKEMREKLQLVLGHFQSLGTFHSANDLLFFELKSS